MVENALPLRGKIRQKNGKKGCKTRFFQLRGKKKAGKSGVKLKMFQLRGQKKRKKVV